MKDLRPYTCTFENCDTGSQLYDSLKDWLGHEVQIHRADVIKRCCPFCFEDPSAQHIAEHLRRVALFSLPRSTDIEDDSNEGGSADVQLGLGPKDSDLSSLAFSSIHEGSDEVDVMKHQLPVTALTTDKLKTLPDRTGKSVLKHLNHDLYDELLDVTTQHQLTFPEDDQDSDMDVNSLLAASEEGNETMVRLLLEGGADVNAQGGEYGTALQAASYKGHREISLLLLEMGADVNAQGGRYGNALQAAIINGHHMIALELLGWMADPNAQGGEHGSALQAASIRGYEWLVQHLLQMGADANAQGGRHGSALKAASFRGYEAVVQTLLEVGADVNAQGGRYNSALQAASYGDHEGVVRLLLDKGADVNAQGGRYGNALQAASYKGNEAIVQLLLDKGANIYARGGHFDTALEAALIEGAEAVVQQLKSAMRSQNAP